MLNQPRFLILSVFLFFVLPTFSQTISIEEIEFLIGREWRGTMTNWDFKTEEAVEVPAVLFVQPDGRRNLRLVYRYPSDSDNISQTLMKIRKNSTRIGKNTIISKKKSKDGTLTIKTSGEGKIQKQKVKYSYIYQFGPNIFAIKRDIYYLETDITITANDYHFSR